MKKLLVQILFILVIFASCQKEDKNSDDVGKTSISKQVKLLENVNEKTEIGPMTEIEPEAKLQGGIITDAQVPIKSAPDLEGETLGYLNTGDKFIILDKSA